MTLLTPSIDSIEALRASDPCDPLSPHVALTFETQPPFPLHCRLAHFDPACDGCRRDADALAASLEELA